MEGRPVPPLPRDVLWAVLQWLAFEEQLCLRGVCRAWCALVQERVTAVPRPLVWTLACWPALLRCHLCKINAARSTPLSDALLAAPCLPSSLRRLTLARYSVPGSLTTLRGLPLVDLTLLKLHVCDVDVDALCSIPTLTRLKLLDLSSWDVASAVRVAEALPVLQFFSGVSSAAPWVPVFVRHGAPSLVGLEAEVTDQLVHTLQSTTRALVALHLSGPLPHALSLAHLTALRSLEVFAEDNDAHMREALASLCAVPTLRALEVYARAPTVDYVSAVASLASLEVLVLEWSHRNLAIAPHLPRFKLLGSLTLYGATFAAGQIRALVSLSSLRLLSLTMCSGDGLAECGSLTQLVHLTVFGKSFDASNLPLSLEALALGNGATQLPLLSRLTALMRLELSGKYDELGDLRWSALRRLQCVKLLSLRVPHSLLYQLVAALPTLERVALVRCSPVRELPFVSSINVRIKVKDSREQ